MSFLKSNGQHYSSWGGPIDDLRVMSEEEIRRLHEVLLSMYKDITSACERLGIRIIAAGGTALGAVRHHGFIPWDDDMDIFMFRDEYELFVQSFDEILGEQYLLLAPGRTQGANCFVPRIMKKGTSLLGMIDESAPYPHGIYIDINILEYAPAGGVPLFLKALGSDFLRFVSYSVYWHTYRSESLRRYMLGSNGSNYYRMRMLIGFLFSFRTPESWFASFDRFVRNKKTTTYTVPTGTKKYLGERLQARNVLPLVSLPFEDTTILVLSGYEKYLTNLYGNYKVVPDAQHRERHLCLELDFGGDR